jgi:WD40 repeat protein
MLTIEAALPVITVDMDSLLMKHRLEKVQFSPDGQTLALASEQRGISFWDPTTGASRGTVAPPADTHVATMAYSPDGRFLAYMFLSLRGRLIGLWDVALKAVRSVYQDERLARSATLRFSPTSEFFAVCPDYEPVRLFDTNTMGVRETKLTVFRGGMSFSPSGRFLAVATKFRGISVKDIIVGKSVGFRESSCGLFSPCDELLAHSVGHTIKFWRPDESRVLPNLVGHTEDIRELIFSSNGRLLASLYS